MRVLSLAMAAMMLAACGGSDDSGSSDGGNNNTTPCTITVSGGSSGTIACGTPTSAFDSSKNQGSVGIGSSGSSSDPNTAIIFVAHPAAPHTGGVYKQTDTGALASITLKMANTAYYSMVAGSTTASDNQGTYTLTYSSVSTIISANGFTSYAVHGTLDATLVAVPNSTATGTANVHITF